MKETSRIELLAPAGSKESFYAAIAYGADAVYLGIDAFNARMGAENIGLDDLGGFVCFAHRRRVKVYITLNTLIRDDEWTRLAEVVQGLVEAKVDAVILQDLGVLTYIQKTYPKLECHASTQFSVYNADGVRRAKELGFARVVIARETPIDEIRKCAQVDGIELEVFVHGALCVSASGQCLLSSTRGGRSGNRGRCAQPCRLNFSLDGQDDFNMPWLSLKDLYGMDHIEELMDIGVHSLKVEGRSKRPAYVAGVIRAYREAIDQDLKNPETRKDQMQRLYYRGFTKGLLNGELITDIGSLDQPNHQGVEIGSLVRFDKGKATVESSHELLQGDGIRYTDKSGKWVGQNVTWVKQTGRDRYVVRLKVEPKVGGSLHLTKDHRLEKSFEWSKIPIEPWLELDGQCDVSVGRKLRLVVAMEGATYVFESSGAVEAAKSRGSREDEVSKHLMKLGGTPFLWRSLQVNIEGLAYVPARMVNEVRRQMEADLWSSREEGLEIQKAAVLEKKPSKKTTMGFTLAIFNEGIGHRIDPTLYDRIWILPDLEGETWVEKARSAGVDVGWTHLYGQLMPEGEVDMELNDWNQSVRDQAFSGPGLFVMNAWSVHRLQTLGLKEIHLSPELSLDQMKVLTQSSKGSFEVMGYGRIPLMSLRHCPMKSAGLCMAVSCDNCSRTYRLTDENQRTYAVVRKGVFGYLLSDQALDHLAHVADLEAMGISRMRVQFWDQSEPIELVEEWIRKTRDQAWPSKEAMATWLDQQGIKGHGRLIERGVL